MVSTPTLCLLQFVVIKPAGAFFAALLQATGKYCNGEWKLNCGYVCLLARSDTAVESGDWAVDMYVP